MIRISGPVGGLLAFLLLAAGALAGAFVLPLSPPQGIVATANVSSASAKQLDITDDQAATLAITAGPERKLVVNVSGTLTATSCTAGGRAESGQSGLAVNDVPIIYLSTPTPLWRDLMAGDHGPDVQSLQDELRRLGHGVRADGRFGPDTLRSVIALAKNAGVADVRTWTSFPVSRFAWLPAPTVETMTCSLQVGDQVVAGDAVAVLPPGIESARLSPEPRDVVPGERVVVVGDLVLPVDDSGNVASPDDLARLAASPAYAAYAAGATAPQASQGGSDLQRNGAAGGVPVTFRLARGLSVYSVPAAAVYAARGRSACVVADGKPAAVTIASSQFGQTLIQPEASQSIAEVSLKTSQAPPCR
ncbi:hypothetical protein GCM10009820_05380 [Leifsonia soli]